MEKQSSVNFAIAINISFTILLIIIRAFISSQFIYFFYVWNLCLAIIPLIISNKLLQQKTMKAKACLLLFVWLLFFPNAPYIVTDLFHFTQREGIPFWYDLVIVTTAAWNGLMLGFISLSHVEKFLSRNFKEIIVKIILFASLILCGFGVYLGRFLRFNSWDIFNNVGELSEEIFSRLIHPFNHTTTWGFSILFATMMGLFYYGLKSIRTSFTKHAD